MKQNRIKPLFIHIFRKNRFIILFLFFFFRGYVLGTLRIEIMAPPSGARKS